MPLPRPLLAFAVLTAAPLLGQTQPQLVDRPLATRTAPPPGGTPFTTLSAEQSGVTVPNLFNDPRMWGDRFREYTLGALETGIAVADFDRDGMPDIYAVSKNGPNALYQQTVAGRFHDIAPVCGVDVADDPAGQTGATAVDINQDGWPAGNAIVFTIEGTGTK